MSPKEVDFEHDYMVKYLATLDERYSQIRNKIGSKEFFTI